MHVIAQSRVRVFIELLDAIKNCADILIKAEEDDRISFDDEVVPVSLEIGSHLLARASRMNSDELNHFLNHVKVDGPRICLEMIKETVDRLPPVMHRTYLVEKLVKPPSANAA